MADQLVAGRTNTPDVLVVDFMKDRCPPEQHAVPMAQRSQGGDGESEGFWHDGRVYLVANALHSQGGMARVLFHAMSGLRGHFGKALDTILNQVAMLRKKDVDAQRVEYGLQNAAKKLVLLQPRRCGLHWLKPCPACRRRAAPWPRFARGCVSMCRASRG